MAIVNARAIYRRVVAIFGADADDDDCSGAIADAAGATVDLAGTGAELEAAGLHTFELAYGEVIAYIMGYAMSRTRGEAA